MAIAAISERAVPHNLEAERALLGSILLDNGALNVALETVSKEDFFSEAHRTTFEKMLDLSEKNRTIDLVTLSEELSKDGLLEKAGGAAYLAALTDGVPIGTAAAVPEYSRIVKEKSLIRRLINASNNVISRCLEGTDDPETLIDLAQSQVFDIAEQKVVSGFSNVRDIVKSSFGTIDVLFDRGQRVTGIETGFVDLDNLTSGLQPGELVVVAGRPSLGKTALALNVAAHAAVKNKKVVGIFSLEMSKESLVIRLLCSEAGIDSHKLRTGFSSREDWNKMMRTLGRLAAAPLFIEDSPALSIMQIRAKARRLKAEKGLDLLIVDFLQLVSGHGRFENRTQEVSFISRSLKSIAKELRVPVMALSQLSRAPEQRPGQRPQLSDLRESGCLAGDTLIMRGDTGELATIKSLAERAQQSPLPVYALDENLKVVPRTLVKAFSSGRKKVYELALRSGRTIKASANHPFRALRGWQTLDSLRVGDHIATPTELEPPEAQGMLSEDEIILLAHLLGDGCILPRQPFHYTSADPENVSAVSSAAKSLFNIVPRVVRQKNWWHVYLPSPRRLARGIRHPIADWFKKLGVPMAHSYGKLMPSAIFRSPYSTVALFLRHLWATDGNISWRLTRGRKPAGAIYYATTSKTLAMQVQHLLLRLGIPSTVRFVAQKGHRPNYHVHVQGSVPQLRFLRIVGTHGARGKIAEELTGVLEAIIPNPNIDVLPKEAWRFLVEPAKAAAGMSWRDVARSIGTAYCGSRLFKHGIGRERLERLATALKSDVLHRHAASEIAWDEIVSIAPLGIEEVYDATVEGAHNFVANDLIVHNSIEQDADVVIFIFRERRAAEEAEGETERGGVETKLIIGKQRNGPTGEVPVVFMKPFARFENKAREQEQSFE
jgi:replicative DNA helicase